MIDIFDKGLFRKSYKEIKVISTNSVSFESQLEVFSSLVKRAGVTDFFYNETIVFDLWRGLNDENLRINTVKGFLQRFSQHFDGIAVEKYLEYPSLCNLLLLLDSEQHFIDNNVLSETIAQNNSVVYKRLLQTHSILKEQSPAHSDEMVDLGLNSIYSKTLAICSIACRQRKGDKQILPQLLFIKNVHEILRDIKHCESGGDISLCISRIAEQDR